eukprot:TRINITY_DN32897_c0_g1_i1.p1 TRINITY_DN32897_c0_g1~~TRINITY_DN32897_c0_g1_i1.p1  ORF type:complete len:248 (+),score=38.45 TRINITY_DN32897_c0_g1_i1:552-1295(+)
MDALVLPAEDQFVRKHNHRLAKGHYCNRKGYHPNLLLPPNPKHKGEDVLLQNQINKSQNPAQMSFPTLLRKPYRSLKPDFFAAGSDLPSGSSFEHFKQAAPIFHPVKPHKCSGNRKKSGFDCKAAVEKSKSAASISIPKKPSRSEWRPTKGESFSFTRPSSENWAGPAYSNSPPPSSLPLPKFSLRERRSVSLELPVVSNELSDISGSSPRVKSVSLPASPSRQDSSLEIASATKNLRRILNLDLDD